MKPTLERIFDGLAALLISTGASSAADLHPIAEVQSGYLFGAISDGTWIKAEETAKLIGDETIFWWINRDQLYDSLRGAPRFEALVQKIDTTKAELKK